MKDKRGHYYYPNPANKRVRAYVRRDGDSIAFRLWNQDDLGLWEQHGWVTWEAIQAAAKLFKGRNFNPSQAYDLELAKALLREAPE
jgi:hypothetical protein